MARLLLAVLLLLPLATPVRAAESAVETQLRYLEKDLDRLREEVKALPEARRLDRLEAEVIGLREAIKAAERSAEEAVKDKLEAQDKRIGDLSTSLTMQANQISWHSLIFNAVSAFITLVLFCVTIWTAIVVPRRAEEAARIKAAELTEKAISQARTEAEKLTEEAAAKWLSEKAEPRLKELETLAEEQRKAHARLLEATISKMDARANQSLRSDGSAPAPEASQDPRVLAEEQNAVEYIRALPEAERSASQWRALIQSLVEQKSFEAALAQADLWLNQPGHSVVDTAFALRTKASVLGMAGRNADAVKLNKDLIQRYGGSQDPNLTPHIAIALVNKGISLANLSPPEWEEAIAAYEDAVTRFGSDLAPVLREQVAKALFNKGFALGQLTPPKTQEAIAAYEDVFTRFGSDPAPALRELVARARLNKGVDLWNLSPPKWEEAIAAYKEVVTRFGSDPAPALREMVAKAHLGKGIALGSLTPPQREAEIAAYEEVIQRFGTDDSPALREQVARALHYKAITLKDLNRPAEARAGCEDYLRRFADALEPDIQEITAEVRTLLNNLPPPEPPADP